MAPLFYGLVLFSGYIDSPKFSENFLFAMELQQLKAFAVAARFRNITKAAVELHTSQPALSKQLKKLEDTYNVKLLVRSGLGVDLTQDGIEFLKYVEPILEHTEHLDRRFLKRRDVNVISVLRIGGGYALSASVLPELIGKFKKEHPKVEVLLRSNTSGTLEQMLLKGSLDLVLTSIAPDSAELITEPCMPMKIIAVVANGYSLPKHKVLTLNDLEKLPLILRSTPDRRGMTETFLRKLRDQGVKPKILMRCDSPEAIKTAVLKKLGVAILYQDIVKDGLAKRLFKQVRIADFTWETQSYVVYHKHRPLSASAEAFLEILRKRCRSPQSQQTSSANMVTD
jgi:DNA-binding transcriptional LysR family regulator